MARIRVVQRRDLEAIDVLIVVILVMESSDKELDMVTCS